MLVFAGEVGGALPAAQPAPLCPVPLAAGEIRPRCSLPGVGGRTEA